MGNVVKLLSDSKEELILSIDGSDIKSKVEKLNDLNIKVVNYSDDIFPTILIKADKNDLEKISDFKWIYDIFIDHAASIA